MSKINISINDNEKNEIERLILVINLGVLTSLQSDSMSYDEAYNYFLRPYLAQYIEQLSNNEQIIQLLEECCMLSDISRLIPEKAKVSIEECRRKTIEQLKRIPKPRNPMYWLNNFDEE